MKLSPILSLVISLVLTSVGFCQNTNPPFSIAISTPSNTVTSTAKIRIDVVLKNMSAHAIPVSKVIRNDEAELDYHIVVRNIRGNEPSETKWGRRLHGKDPISAGDNASRIAGHLNPGDTLHEYTILNNIYDLTAPGKYSVRVDRRDVETDKIVKSNTLVINVTR